MVLCGERVRDRPLDGAAALHCDVEAGLSGAAAPVYAAENQKAGGEREREQDPREAVCCITREREGGRKGEKKRDKRREMEEKRGKERRKKKKSAD